MNKGDEDNSNLILLPSETFIRLTLESDLEITDLERNIIKAQQRYPELMKHWEETKQVSYKRAAYTQELTACRNGLQTVIPPEDSLKREILKVYHDSLTSGHPG